MRIFALFVGLASLASFAAAVLLMAVSLWTGMRGSANLTLPYAYIWDIILVLQFPFLHSYLLNGGRHWLDILMPTEIAKRMRPTMYSTFASWQLIMVFSTWQSTGITVFVLPEMWVQVFAIIFGISWILLVRSMNEAGMHVQTGVIGWWSVFRNKATRFPEFPSSGMHAQCRHPIYLSFSMILLSSPAFTVDRLVLAAVWIAYCLVGPIFKERRLQLYNGEKYGAYKQKTPYFMPRLSWKKSNVPANK